MSRDDSTLYTGATSASFTTPRSEQVKAKAEANKQVRREAQHKLKPAAEIVLGIIEEHKTSAMHVSAVTTQEHLDDKSAGELLRSQRKIYAFLLAFEQEIKIALREKSDG